MSHFTVMVIGDDHNAQLAPYHDFECTGVNDEYVEDEDITDVILALIEEDYQDEDDPLEQALGSYDLEDRVVSNEDEIDLDGEHKYGYAVVKDSELISAVIRTNPNKRWDWYQVGGRWSGMLKMKPGKTGIVGDSGVAGVPAADGHADQARKGDIDWDGMRNHAAEQAEAYWDKIHAIAPDGWLSWDRVVELYPNDTEAARNFYFNQKGLRAVLDSDKDIISADDNVLVSREEYVQAARQSAGMTYSVIQQDGDWVSSEDMTDSEWRVWMCNMIDSLDDNSMITIVDCHM